MLRDRLTSSIGDWVHSHGLTFNIASSARFKKVLSNARFVDMKYYNTPNTHMIGGKLLDNSYADWKSHNNIKLHKEAETFGLAACGDGATVT